MVRLYANGVLMIDVDASFDSRRLMRYLAVTEALAQELPEPVYVGGLQRESDPAEAGMAQPDAQAARREGSDLE